MPRLMPATTQTCDFSGFTPLSHPTASPCAARESTFPTTWQFHVGSHTKSCLPERLPSEPAAPSFLSVAAMTPACPPCQTPLFHLQKPCILLHFSFPVRLICGEMLVLNYRKIWFVQLDRERSWVRVFSFRQRQAHLQNGAWKWRGKLQQGTLGI